MEHSIHEGECFLLEETKYGVAASASFALSVSTQTFTEEYLHIIFGGEGTGAIQFKVYEGVTVNGGTPTIPHNSRRGSPKTISASMAIDPTVSDYGTKLTEQWAGAGKQVGGKYRVEEGIVLDENTCYLFLIESDAVDNTISGWMRCIKAKGERQ